eukprot:862475-Rhodomonas_salina.1
MRCPALTSRALLSLHQARQQWHSRSGNHSEPMCVGRTCAALRLSSSVGALVPGAQCLWRLTCGSAWQCCGWRWNSRVRWAWTDGCAAARVEVYVAAAAVVLAICVLSMAYPARNI